MTAPNFTPDQRAEIDELICARIDEALSELSAPAAARSYVIQKNAEELSRAMGRGIGFITALRRAGRTLGDPVSKYATEADVHAWLARHPEFIADSFLKKPILKKT